MNSLQHLYSEFRSQKNKCNMWLHVQTMIQKTQHAWPYYLHQCKWANIWKCRAVDKPISQSRSQWYLSMQLHWLRCRRSTSKSTPKLLAICSCKNYMAKTTTCQPTLPTFRAHTALHGISLRWPIQWDPSRPLMCSIIMQHCVMGCSCAELQN